MGSYEGKVKTSLAFLSEMTLFEIIADMLVVNVFPAVFVTLGPAIFSTGGPSSLSDNREVTLVL